MDRELRSASEHPPTWRFDLPIFHPEDLAAWRRWLEQHHRSERGVWVATWRRATGRTTVPYEQLVEEALCFGWIDATVHTLDEDRNLQLVTPRKPRSSWTRLNRRRVAAMEAAGRMTEAGRAAVEVARANGWWERYDQVEDLVVPADLRQALDASPPAAQAWDSFPPSARKQLLWSVVSAVRPETRAARIAKVVGDVAQGRRPGG